MMAEKIRTLRRAQPFQPFVILLNDGRKIPVTNPEWLLVTEGGGSVGVFQKDDSLSMFETSMIREIKVRAFRRGERAKSA